MEVVVLSPRRAPTDAVPAPPREQLDAARALLGLPPPPAGAAGRCALSLLAGCSSSH
eukprot:CAMPEP_0194345188 /NCGR_PEP_ID=MMETSP0171-20130528/104717_1 /TAXON_ID=218684 /ORGANISM="Corethron pennatum, Strain L29A3" /LENGTH=56 /DNA_ID=CAMNT_0039112141 /DNA_START=875 /DNA_END=1042 /DNA_ORIENTATION=+